MSVLSQSTQENTRTEGSDETDLRQFDEIMDVGDTPLDDLQPLGDVIPRVDLPRHASLASSLDECESTITRVSPFTWEARRYQTPWACAKGAAHAG